MFVELALVDLTIVQLFFVKHILDTILMIYILHQFFDYRLTNPWVRGGLVLLIAFCLTGLYVLGQALLVIVGVMLLSVALCHLVFLGERKQLFSMTILLCVIRVLFEFIPFGLFSVIWQKPAHSLGADYPERIWLIACSVCLSYLAGLFLVRWKKRSNDDGMERYLSSNLIYTIIPLVNVGVLAYILYLNANIAEAPIGFALLFFLITMGIIVSTFVTFFAYAMDHQRMRLAYRLQEEALRSRYAQELYDLQQQNLKQIRKITHDFNNHLMILSTLAEKDPALASYNQDLHRDVSQVRALLPQGIQNETLQVILYHYKDTCKTHQIDLQLDIRYDDFSFLSHYDLSGILFNALDNAVHAAGRVRSGSICFLIKKTASMVLLSIENSCPVEEMPTRKQNKPPQKLPGIHDPSDIHDTHGYGCGNIRDLVQKNEGQLTIVQEKGIYRLMILFPIQKK